MYHPKQLLYNSDPDLVTSTKSQLSAQRTPELGVACPLLRAGIFPLANRLVGFWPIRDYSYGTAAQWLDRVGFPRSSKQFESEGCEKISTNFSRTHLSGRFCSFGQILGKLLGSASSCRKTQLKPKSS
jgi:hypothetical protein